MAVNPTLIKLMSATNLFWYRLTGGLIGGSFAGRRVLLLTTTGRKSGKRRTTPLLYLTEGDDLLLAASNGGNDWHPDWYLNLVKHPEAEVQIGRAKKRVLARTAASQERQRLWSRFVDTYSGYAGYERATEREIPVVVLRPQE
jgi:deazaflavin-dependent oxidoreductase (nitroreductase family)